MICRWVLIAGVALIACNETARVVPIDARPAPPIAESKRTLVRRTPRPPALDGALDDGVWKRAAVAGGFVDVPTGWPAALRTEVRLLWDARHLYLAVHSLDGNLGDVTVMIHGAAVGTGSIDVDLPVSGAVTARHRSDTSPVASEALPFHGRAARGAQQLEIAIPMTDLAPLACPRAKVPPSPMDVWGVNVLRRAAVSARPPLAAWSRRVAGDLHRLDQFGEMVFVDEGGEDPISDEGREEREREEEEREQRRQRAPLHRRQPAP
jgi:hypothetical protein